MPLFTLPTSRALLNQARAPVMFGSLLMAVLLLDGQAQRDLASGEPYMWEDVAIMPQCQTCNHCS